MRMRRAKEAAEEAESRSAPPVASFVAQCFLGPSVVPVDPALGSMRLLRLDATCRARDILRMVAATPYSGGVASRRQPLIVQAALGDGTPNTSVPAMPMEGLAAQSEGFAFPYMVWVGSEEDRELALMPPWERELLERQRARATEADGSGEDEEEADGGRPLSVATEDDDDDGNGREEFAAIETDGAAEEVGDNGSTGLAIQSPEPGPLTPVDPLRSPGAKPPPTPASAAQRRLKRQRREEERRRREALAAKREAALKAKEEARKGAEAEARRMAAERERAFEEQRAADRAREIIRAERRDESKAAIIRDKAVQHSKRESRLSDIKRRYDAAITSGNAPSMSTPGLAISPSAWMQSVRHTGPRSAHRDEDDPDTATEGTSGVSDLLPSAHRSRGLYGDSVDPAIAALDASVEASAKAAVEQQLRDKEVLRANVQDEYLKHLVKVNTQRKAAVKRDARTRAAEALHQVEFVGANSIAKGHSAVMM